MNSISLIEEKENGAGLLQAYGSIGNVSDANNADVNNEVGNISGINDYTEPSIGNKKILSFSAAMVAFLFVLHTTFHLGTFVIPTNTNPSNSNILHIPATPKAPLKFQIPFPQVDRADYGDAVESFLQEDLFASHLRATSGDGHNKFVFPFPTGAFWINFALPSTADSGISYPIAVYPYAYKWSSEGFVQASYAASHRQQDATTIRDAFYPDLTIASVEDVAERKIQKFDPLSITLRFNQNEVDGDESKSSPYFESYLVQGSPYITVKYDALTPSIRALSTFTDFQSIHSDTIATENDSVSGTQFIANTREGLQWLIVASEPTTLIFDKRNPTTITGSTEFTGVLRFACLPFTTSDKGFMDSSGLKSLREHASVYPTGGNVDWTFRSTKKGRVATLHFDFTTNAFAADDDDVQTDLLMLALPHHAELISKHVQLTTDDEFDLSFECIKGRMTAITGSSWKYDEPLIDIGFAEGPGSVVDDKILNDPRVRDSLIENLQRDVKIALPVLNENIYGYGKQAARLAQLAFIAAKLVVIDSHDNDTMPDGNDLKKLVADTVQALYKVMQSLLDAETNDKLVYDANLGGIVTSDGLDNTQADFGNGRYNDHHFHYGYVLYASAILGKLKPSFVTEYGDKVDALYYDVANDVNVQSSKPSNGAFLPGSRHKLWFDGHSYASGLFAFGNGKSQESSSEAVNCYYGAYMWSLVSHGASEEPERDLSARTDFARLLLATEIRGTKTYWQMIPPEKSSSMQMAVYNPAFAKNYMVGNVGMLDVVCTTWFGTNKLYVHMINFIPVTAAAAALFDKTYVEAEYNNVLAPMHEIDEAWRGFVIADHAIMDPNAAWAEAQQLFSPTLDAGLSKTQVLFFIATRKGFNVEDITEDISSSSEEHQGTSDSFCRNHPACVDANLVGECCPTPEGSFLGCCGSTNDDTSKAAASDDEAPAASDTDESADADAGPGTSSSSCSSNPFCASANLVGECCPTLQGSFLGCCGSAKTSSSIKAPVSGEAVVVISTDDAASASEEQGASSSSCSSNPSCADADLVGECCPTPEGTFLGCCSSTSGSSDEVATTSDEKVAATGGSGDSVSDGTSSSSCRSNSKCADLDLIGECCPTPEGSFLGCCD